MDINASAIAAQTAQSRNNAALGFIKSNQQAETAIANVLTENIQNAPTGGRGSIVDISA